MLLVLPTPSRELWIGQSCEAFNYFCLTPQDITVLTPTQLWQLHTSMRCGFGERFLHMRVSLVPQSWTKRWYIDAQQAPASPRYPRHDPPPKNTEATFTPSQAPESQQLCTRGGLPSYNHAGAVFHPPLPPLLLSGGSRGGQPPSASVPPASSCCCPPRHRFLLLLLLLHAEREDPAAPKCSASVRTFGSLALWN